MKLKNLFNIFKGSDDVTKIENNGDLSSLPPEVLQIIVSYLDSKSVLNVRTLSKDHLEKIHYFLSDLEVAKKTGLVNLGLQDLIAVGENVMHRKHGISDFYGKPKEPGSKKINKSFEKRVTLFTNETDADAHIKKHTQNNEFGYLESKPHKTVVTVKNPNTLFRIQKPTGKETNLVLSVSDKEEITKKLEFK